MEFDSFSGFPKASLRNTGDNMVSLAKSIGNAPEMINTMVSRQVLIKELEFKNSIALTGFNMPYTSFKHMLTSCKLPLTSFKISLLIFKLPLACFKVHEF